MADDLCALFCCCHVFQFFGSRELLAEVLRNAVKMAIWNLSSCSALVTMDAMIHVFCFLLISLKTLLFPHCSLFKKQNTHHVTFRRFSWKQHVHVIFSSSSSSVFVEGSSTIRSTTIADGKFDPGFRQSLRLTFFFAQGVPCGGGGCGFTLSYRTNMTLGKSPFFDRKYISSTLVGFPARHISFQGGYM